MSFLKKLIKKKDEEGHVTRSPQTPAGMAALPTELQMKYAKGVQYNMRVIIKGDRNVGKTTLFLRLQGQKFREEYMPTEEIQVANIQWSYKTTDDIVKVEVWDVVDKARRKKADGSLKLEHTGVDGADDSPRLDAQFIDVYKGTHAVIMMYDMTKLWTWQYVEREIVNVPPHIPVLVMANHRDMGAHRTVELETTQYFISSLDRGDKHAPVRATECCMANGFGLKYLHKFFNVPFLALQKATLLKQLECNATDTKAIEEELNWMEEVESYDQRVEDAKKKMSSSINSKPVLSSNSLTALSINSKASSHTLTNSRNSPNLSLLSSAGASGAGAKTSNIDDFKPDESDDMKEFLTTTQSSSLQTSRSNPQPHSRAVVTDLDEDDSYKPEILGYQDDFDSSGDEDVQTPIIATGKIASAEIALSASDDDKHGKKTRNSISSDTESEESKQFEADNADLTRRTLMEPRRSSSAAADKSQAVMPELEDDTSSDDELRRPSILTVTEDISDEEPACTAVKKKTTSLDVILTDSEPDSKVSAAESFSDDPNSAMMSAAVPGDTRQQQQQLPDIAISHQAVRLTSTTKHERKVEKTKTKTTKPSTVLNSGNEDAMDKKIKRKKKTKKDASTKKEKTRSKVKSSSASRSKDRISVTNPATDPLEAFLADNEDLDDSSNPGYEMI